MQLLLWLLCSCIALASSQSQKDKKHSKTVETQKRWLQQSPQYVTTFAPRLHTKSRYRATGSCGDLDFYYHSERDFIIIYWIEITDNVTKRDAGSSKRVVCYYTNWSVYRPGTAKFSPQNINPYLCTHLIYAFGGLSRENGLRPYDKYQDIEQGGYSKFIDLMTYNKQATSGYAKFTGLKTYNKQLKTMLAIGGWNEGSARFSSLVADEERRAEFVKNVIRFLRQNHFDGLDLDWEYPAFRDGGKPRDRDNYAMLVQELREEFDRETAKTGRARLLLTMAVPAGIEYIDKGFDIPKLNRYLDFMNILSYDYHSAFEPSVNHHSPLFPLEEDSEYNFDSQLSIDYTINHYLKLGADRDKLVLGIPTYGRSYTLFNPLANEVGAPADGPGEQGDATREKGYLAYYEICEFLQSNEWKVEKPNPNAMGPYAYKGNQWVGYDDEDIVRLKARYVSENNLGGIMFWAIDNDDFRGKCHGRPYPLIEAAKEAMLKSSGLSNEVVSSNRKQRPRPRPTSATNTRVRTSDTNTRNRDTNTSSRRRNKNKNRSSTTTTTTTTSTTTPKYDYPVTTPEPPTTPDPGSDFKCEDEGFFPHPRDCKKYFWCLDSGPSNLGIVAHQFTCPSGLVFNKAADSCDYARNVICKIKGASKAEGGGPSTKSPPITAATSRTTKFSSSTTTSTTTTTTTTPPPPEEDEEYEDYEDEEVVESHEDVEEDPKAIQELINLIKKLGGIEQLEKQLQAQEKNSAGAPGGISKSLYERVLSRNVNRNNNDRGPTVLSRSTTVSPDASTRYTSIFRNRPLGPQNEGLEEIPSRFERPQYVTIKRDRPSTVAPDVDEEDFEEDDDVPVDDTEEEEVIPRGRDYVNIRKARPDRPEYADTTTSKYVVIERRKPTPEPEQEEEQEDMQIDDKSPEEESVSSPKPTRRTYQTRLPSTEETSRVPLRSGKLNVINKEEEVELSTKQDVEIETETTTPQVSGDRFYVDIASIRSTSPRSLLSPQDNLPDTADDDFDRTSTLRHRSTTEEASNQLNEATGRTDYVDIVSIRTTSPRSLLFPQDKLPDTADDDFDGTPTFRHRSTTEEASNQVIEATDRTDYVDIVNIRTTSPRSLLFPQDKLPDTADDDFDGTPTFRHRSTTEEVSNQVIEVTGRANYVDTGRFRTTTTGLDIILQDQSSTRTLPTIAVTTELLDGIDLQVSLASTPIPTDLGQTTTVSNTAIDNTVPSTTPLVSRQIGNLDLVQRRRSTTTEVSTKNDIYSTERQVYETVSEEITPKNSYRIRGSTISTTEPQTLRSSEIPIVSSTTKYKYKSRRRGTTSTTVVLPTTTTITSGSSFSETVSKGRNSSRPTFRLRPKFSRISTTTAPVLEDSVTPSPNTTTTSRPVYTTILTLDTDTFPPTTVDTLPPPTTTRFTPTVTRVVTSVIESGTTERQRIAVNRVPYRSLIAAQRAKQSQKGDGIEDLTLSYSEFERTTSPTDTTIPPTTFQDPNTTRNKLRFITTGDIIAPEHKIEKIMEINRITSVTIKEDFKSDFPTNPTTLQPETQAGTILSQVEEIVTNKTPVIPTLEMDKANDGVTELFHPTVTMQFYDITVTESHLKTTDLKNTTEKHRQSSVVMSEQYETIPASSTTMSDRDLQITSQSAITTEIEDKATTNIIEFETETANKYVSSFSDRDATEAPGLLIKTTEQVNNEETNVTLPTTTYLTNRPNIRMRPRQYRPTATSNPKEGNERQVIRVRKPFRPLNDFKDNENGTKNSGGFSRRRVYRPPSTSTTESSRYTILGETRGNKDVPKRVRGFTRGRVYRLPTRSTTEFSETVTEQETDISSNAKEDIKTTTDMQMETSSSESTNDMPHTGILENKMLPTTLRENDDLTNNDSTQQNTGNKNSTSTTPIVQEFQNGMTFPTEVTISTTLSVGLVEADTLKSTVNETNIFTSETTSESFKFPASTISVFTNNEQDNLVSEQPSINLTTLENSPTPASQLVSKLPNKRVRVKTIRKRPQTNISVSPARSLGSDIDNEVDNSLNEPNTYQIIKEDPPTDEEKHESLATLEDTNHHFISTESPSSAEYATTVDEEGKHLVNLAVVNNDPTSIDSSRDEKRTSEENYYTEKDTNRYVDENLNTRTMVTTNYLRRGSTNTPDSSASSKYVPNDYLDFPLDISDEKQRAIRPQVSVGRGVSKFRSRNDSIIHEVSKSQVKLEDTSSTQADFRRGSVRRFQSTEKAVADERGDNKRRKVVRRRRPSTVADDNELQVTQEEVITTIKPRRQPGTLFTSRQRQRGTTNSVAFTTAAPPPKEVTTKQGGGLQRRVIKRRKYGPRAQDNDASPTDVTPLNATIVDNDKGDAVVSPTNRTRKFSFPKRRASTSTTAATPVNEDAQVQPSAFVEESQPLEKTEDLPDLANVAVAALTNLATPDGGFGQDVATSASQDMDWDNATTSGSISRHMEVTAMDNLSEDLLDQANKNTEKSVSLINTKRVRGGGTFRGSQKGRLENGASQVVGDSDDVLRTSVLPASRKLSRYTTSTSPRQASTTPSPSPTSSPLRRQPLRPRPYTKIPSAPKSTEGAAPLTRKTPPPAIIDYEYYDDDDQGFVESSPKSNKVMVHSDGYIECLDQGSFPHPYSCKKFISCAKMENGGLLGWEYTCPKQLSFDPVGGICNWSSGLGCKE
uniref:Chitinase n=1 Tax=Timema monikensis TaxID=170555 RepID=A0A7R9HIA3_9NEOP|nr:unnamed protein product [Timema monikensis]